MRISQKAQKCGLSPMRKFHPYAVAAKAAGKKVYHLNIGQPDIKTPPAFFEALRSFDSSVLAYAASGGTDDLLHAVQRYYKKLGVDYRTEDILITTGGSEALLMTMLCLLDEGDEVIIPEPFYPNYASFVSCAGGTIRPVRTTPEDGYRYATREQIEPLICEKTRAILVTNPGNPTGTVLTPEEMQLLASIAREHGLFLIADEVYREFIYDEGGTLSTFASFAGLEDNLILIDSVSKRFSACGARIGALLSKNADVIANCMKFCQARLAAATLDQVGAAALYQVEDTYFDAVRAEYRHRRDVCYQKLLEIPGVVVVEPRGAFYAMAKLPVDDADAFQQWLLTEFSDHGETVMFAPGASFYATPGLGKSEIRIAYVLNDRDLSRALELLKLAIAQYQERNGKNESV